MFSLLIKNAKVIDGTGKAGEVLDVAVEGDRIVNIGRNIAGSAQTIIDASGKILAPGFIDLQNHSDSYWQLFDNPSLDSLITQGFTTIVIGNCGASLAPLLSNEALLSIQKWHTTEGANINWQSFSQYIEELSRHRFGCNVASLVGYSTMRRGIVGDQVRSLQKPEMAAMKRILEESLEAGAFGLSSGLSYSHEIIISELELYELGKIIAKKDALFSLHLRSEGSEIVEAVEEAIDIARTTECNFKISHLKVRGENNWDKLHEVIEQLDTAYTRGSNIHFDLYPYDTIWQVLYAYLPKWAIEGGRAMMIKHFSDPVQKNKILMYLNNSGVKFRELMVTSTANKLNFTGKKISQIAKNMESSSEQAVLHLIENGGSEVMVFEKNLNEQQVNELSVHPLSFIATDGGGFGINTPGRLVHPRCFGTSAKFLKAHVNDTDFKLEDAIKKLTSGPAKKIGLKKRGSLVVGNFADMVLFDPETITDNSTYENPYQFCRGINYVFVNGKAVVTEAGITKDRPGYVLRKS